MLRKLAGISVMVAVALQLGPRSAAPAAPGYGPKNTVSISSRLAGALRDEANAVALDEDGNIYVTGSTGSRDFPVRDAAQPNLGGTGSSCREGMHCPDDAFVAKLDRRGRLLWSTYLGGDEIEQGLGIAVSPRGEIWVSGITYSEDFPVTKDAVKPITLPLPGGDGEGFVTAFTPDGEITYSTYLGGDQSGDGASRIAVDDEGHAYVTGLASSADFPRTTTLSPVVRGDQDAFVCKFLASHILEFCALVGGSGRENGADIAVDAAGSPVIVGTTNSGDFPTENAMQAALGGAHDAFIAALAPDGMSYRFSTYWGTSRDEWGQKVLLGDAGSAYAVANRYRQESGGVLDSSSSASVLRVDLGSGTASLRTTIAPTGGADVSGLAPAPNGGFYVAGTTASRDIPLKNALYGPAGAGTWGFLLEFDRSGDLRFGSYLGIPRVLPFCCGLASRRGAVVVAGGTSSSYGHRVASVSPSRGAADALVMKLYRTGSGCKLTGSSRRDSMRGTGKRDVLCGRGNDDFIHGGRGNDVLKGGRGMDTLVGGRGRDRCPDARAREVVKRCRSI